MTNSVREHDEADELSDDDWLEGRDLYPLDAEFSELPAQDRHLGYATKELDELYALLTAKARTHIYVRAEHLELGEVRDEWFYEPLRARLLHNARLSERAGLFDHAARVLPERVHLVTTMSWPAWAELNTEIEDLRSKFDHAYSAANLNRFQSLFDEFFQTIREKRRFIVERTERKTSWQRYLDDETDKAMGAFDRRRRALPAPTPAPTPEPAKKVRQSRKGIGGPNKKPVDFDLYIQIGRQLYRDYDSAPKGDKGPYPSLDRITAAYNLARPNEKDITTDTVEKRFREAGRVWRPRWRSRARAVERA